MSVVVLKPAESFILTRQPSVKGDLINGKVSWWLVREEMVGTGGWGGNSN